MRTYVYAVPHDGTGRFLGAHALPVGDHDAGESIREAASRVFVERTGQELPDPDRYAEDTWDDSTNAAVFSAAYFELRPHRFNELARRAAGRVMDVRDDSDWRAIEGWRRQRERAWSYYILANLRNRVLRPPVPEEEPADQDDVAYAVLHDAGGCVFLATRNRFGHYFHDGRGGGVVLPHGIRLHGGGADTLPGGRRRDGETVVAAAARELMEETGYRLDAALVRERAFTVDGTRVCAAYFELSGDDFRRVTDCIRYRSLVTGRQARARVQRGEITSYDEIHRIFPNAPADDELSNGRVLDVFDEQDWDTIDGWCADADQRWLRTILLGLRELLSSPPTGPRRAPTVAAADRDG